MEDIAARLLLQAAALTLVALLSAAFLSMAARWVAKIQVSYGHACVIVLMAATANLIVRYCIKHAFEHLGNTPIVVIGMSALSVSATITIYAAVIRFRLRIAFGRAVLVALAMIGIFLAFVLLTVVVGGLFFIVLAFFLNMSDSLP